MRLAKVRSSGVIDGDGIGGAVGDETLLFWNQLAAANMISGVSPLGAAVIGDGLPSAPVGGEPDGAGPPVRRPRCP